MRSLALFTLLSCAACASTPRGPFFEDEKYLRFGVEPDAEADALVKEREKLGDGLALRIAGQYFTALGFVDRNGDPVAVRVVTARGIELALDRTRGAALAAKVQSFELLPAPIPGKHDADGDGFEEVFVVEKLGATRCLRVYRVRDVGFVDLVDVPVQLFGQDSCASEVTDLDGDGRVELLARAALRGVEFPRQAAVHVPLYAREHRFVLPADRSVLAKWLGDERAGRRIELEEARRLLDVRWALRMGFELSALALLEGASRDAQLHVFDDALSGLILDADEQAAVLEARKVIEATWSTTPSPPAQ